MAISRMRSTCHVRHATTLVETCSRGRRLSLGFLIKTRSHGKAAAHPHLHPPRMMPFTDQILANFGIVFAFLPVFP
jgi:hypothetical protein